MSFQDYADDLEIDDARGARVRKGAAVVVTIVVVAILGLFGYRYYSQNSNSAFEIEPAKASQETPSLIYVHVTGEVNSPGLIEIEEGSRVAGAIEAAGGATDAADLGSVNLAQVLEDGEQIVVASKVDEQAASSGLTNGKVNINSADLTTLQTLNGVGPAKAAKIISYREANGRFKKVDELTNVSGIGETLFAQIKDQICV